jgi:hypothetical protein
VPSSKVAEVHQRDGFYFKRYLIRDWRDVLKHAFRPSRARRALQRGEELTQLGIHTPRAVCLIEEKRGGFVRGSALVTETIDNAPNLRAWLNTPELGVEGNRKKRRALLAAFAREVARWHNAGLHHADMRIGNILCRPDAAGWIFHWLDNEGNRRYAALPEAERVHNLMQVNMERTGITMADRMFFWRVYAEACGLPAERERAIQFAVIDYTQRRWKERGWLRNSAPSTFFRRGGLSTG